MRKSVEDCVESYLGDDDVEQNIYDSTGGDWDDLCKVVEDAFKAGWQAALDNLTTRDI